MNKILIALISVALVTGCTGKQTPKDTHDHETHEACQSHDGHDHAAEGHNHEAEGHDHERENLDHQHEGEAGHPAGEIVFTKEQAAETDFALHKVEPTTFYEVIPASGQILAAQGDEATVVATVSGVVSFSSKKLSEGASVSRGENLFYISSKNIAEGDYTARTRAAFAQAKAAYERAEELVKDKIISQSEYEQAKLNYQNAKTAQEAVANKTTAKGRGVGAPIGGFIKNIAVSEGQFVEVGQLLATISQNRRLKLKTEVSQRYHGALPTISSANFKTSYDDKTYSLKDLGGRLVSVGKASDGASAYIPVTFEFDNKGGIVSGSFVEVFLISSPKPNTLTVPVTALIEEQGNYSVFVQIDEDGYRKQEVKLGASDGKNIQILAGLEPGDNVVSRGAYRVKMASFSGAIPHGHQH